MLERETGLKGSYPVTNYVPAPQGADSLPPPLREAKTGENPLNVELNLPPPPQWDRREI